MTITFPNSSQSPWTGPNGVTYTWNTAGYWEALGGGSGSGENLIINGAMTVAQRNTSLTGIINGNTGGYCVVDRFRFVPGSLGTWTATQEADGPPGFRQSFKMECTTAQASPAANAFVFLEHRLEGTNLQQLAYGTSSAKVMTLSFWVRSNKTGNASFNVLQSTNSYKQFVASYQIQSADTWEKKVIDIPADTAGIVNYTVDEALRVQWFLNSGSNYSSGTEPTDWEASNNVNRNTQNLGVGGAVGDYFQITGIQLEVGSSASAFDYESYAETYTKCQRYYQVCAYVNRTGVTNNTTIRFGNNYPTPMRATPTPNLIQTSGTVAINLINWRSVEYQHNASSDAQVRGQVQLNAEL